MSQLCTGTTAARHKHASRQSCLHASLTCQHLSKFETCGVHCLCCPDWLHVCLKVETGATEPIQPDGALMLGGDQDCYGGCTDPTQAYHGLMDEV